jgi:hypothetical protein
VRGGATALQWRVLLAVLAQNHQTTAVLHLNLKRAKQYVGNDVF